jgi:hypothetical protein
VTNPAAQTSGTSFKPHDQEVKMEELHWTDEQKQLGKAAVRERFALNSVANQFVPQTSVDKTTTTVPWSRYDFGRQMVLD